MNMGRQRGTFSSSRRDQFGHIHQCAVASTWSVYASRRSARVTYSKLLYAQDNVPLGMPFPDEERVPRLTRKRTDGALSLHKVRHFHFNGRELTRQHVKALITKI